MRHTSENTGRSIDVTLATIRDLLGLIILVREGHESLAYISRLLVAFFEKLGELQTARADYNPGNRRLAAIACAGHLALSTHLALLQGGSPGRTISSRTALVP